MAVARLEYRALEEAQGFPVLYYYENISLEEVAMRVACDYLVKNGIVYEKTSSAIEKETYVVYVKVAEEEQALAEKPTLLAVPRAIRIELREFREETAEYPVVHVFEFSKAMEALLHLQSDYHYVEGQEWLKSSVEVDEDRRVYVLYAQRMEEGSS
jgi:hypothetical protein